MDNIRNFSIIAHIDHGKSTLADRLIERCGLVTEREFRDQLLDTMDIERERGITIKSQAITLPYKAKDGKQYSLNLIDTPGHVDFSFEVSRALASCEGVLLLVDASQGVEAQTLANLYLALDHDLEIIPVINKIDLPSADVEATKIQIIEDLGLDGDEAILCSAKDGIGTDDVLEAVVRRIPKPEGDPEGKLKALTFDAAYDPYRGTIVYFRVFEGRMRPGRTIRFMARQAAYKVEEVGLLGLKPRPQRELSAGQVGYVIAGIKSVSDVQAGDTITDDADPADEPLIGFVDVKPVVFSSIYPMSTDEYQDLADALAKLKLNDASLVYQKDTSAALGFGFRCGFLGLLHLEVIQERLRREFGLSLILTVPTVKYRLDMTTGETVEVDNPAYYPDETQIEAAYEPYIKATIIMPEKYLGVVMTLCLDRRGVNPRYNYTSPGRLEYIVEMPLSEVLYDYYDKLKTVTQGYGSFDYDLIDYRKTDLVKLDILVNGETVDALAQLVHRDRARARALHACEKLKDEIPRQMFKIAIQGAIGSTIIARSNVSPFRKDVTAKCYGGDVTRKRKLLEKQKAGKKRMKQVGNVMIPQRAFLAVLKSDE